MPAYELDVETRNPDTYAKEWRPINRRFLDKEELYDGVLSLINIFDDDPNTRAYRIRKV